MKKYVLPYGQGSKEIELDETLVLKEVRTKEFEPMKNIPYEILEAIYHPIGWPSDQRDHQAGSEDCLHLQ